MTDLNTNQYLYKQPYLQNQPGYGDNKSGFPISIDDKRLDPVKDNFKTNPVGKVVNSATSSDKDNKDGLMKMPILLALGSIPTYLIDKTCKKLIKGENFKDSLLGKLVNKIDAFSNSATSKVPALKMDWAKNAFEKVKNGNGILSQLINAKAAKPVVSMAKSMVMPQQNMVLKELLEEAVSVSRQDPKAIEGLAKALEKGTKGISKKAYREALKLVGNNSSEKFIALKNRAHSLSNMSKRSPLSKLLVYGYNGVSKIFNIGTMGSGVKGKMGPLFGFLMTAYFLGETVKKTIDAPKEEKRSTLAHGVIVDFISSWLLFEPITKFMYKGIGALKAVEGKGLSKIITKPLNWAGKLLNTGLNMKPATTTLGKVLNRVKGIGGGAGRFALMMMVLFPIVDKMARFVSHSIFGKPNALLAKEKAEAESGKTENAATSNNTDDLKKALEQNKAGMITVAAKNQINSTGNTNPMIEKHLKEKEAASVVKPEPAQEIPVKQQYIPSDSSKIQQENIEKKAKFDATLAKVDSIIKNAENALSSKE